MQNTSKYISATFIIYGVVAFFVPFPLIRNTNLIIGMLAILFWGKYLLRYNQFTRLYIFIILFLFARFIAQYIFSGYQSPHIFGDLYRALLFLLTIYIFSEIFNNENVLIKFFHHLWIFSYILIIAIILSHILDLEYLKIDDQGRLRWFAWPNSGGPGFSKMFTFLGVVFLYQQNHRHPNIGFRTKIYTSVKLLPHVLLCILGGTRLSLLIFIIAILIYFKINKRILYLFPISIGASFQVLNELLSKLPGFERLAIDTSGGRVMIWSNFYEKITENTSAILWGYGPGYIMTKIYVPGTDIIGGYFYATHNMFLQIWLGYGIIIAMIFVILYIRFVFKVYHMKHPNQMIYGLLAYVVSTEILGTSYLMYDYNWSIAVAYAVLINSLVKNKKNI
jgi:O-antigen ligase